MDKLVRLLDLCHPQKAAKGRCKLSRSNLTAQKRRSALKSSDPVSFEVLKSIYYTRKQFPLMLSFAITIHKSQGMSLNTAIVDDDSTNFGSG